MGIDFSAICLGKHPARFDERTLKMVKYLTPGLPPAPSIVDWTPLGIDWGMMGNDTLGDCTWAAFGHAIQVVTGNNGTIFTPPDAAVEGAYLTMTGGRDTGCNELDVLNAMTSTGLAGHKIQAYASIEAGSGQLDLPTLQQTIYLFGFAYIGIQLPSAWQGKELWDVYGPLSNHQNQPGSWGGHAVILIAYIGSSGTLQFSVVTWGGIIPITQPAVEAYIDEAWAVLSPDWLANKVAPNAIDQMTMAADLQLVRAA